MKKLLLLLISVVVIIGNISAQDLIVTNEGDSINCSITQVKSDKIYFVFSYEGEIRNTLLPESEIREVQYNFYQISTVPKKRFFGHEKYQHVRVGIQGGYGYRTAKISENTPEDFVDYAKKLKSGYQIGWDAHYYFTPTMGLGIRYSLYRTTGSMDNIYAIDSNGGISYGSMRDDISISFIGPSFSTRISNYDNSKTFFMNIAVGCMDYLNNQILIDKYVIQGRTFGVVYDVGFDLDLTDYISIGFQISSISGVLSEYEWSDGKTTEIIKLTDEKEGLNRIDLSVGLRFNI